MRREPSATGKRKYPPDGFYTANADGDEVGTPCTCREKCDAACKGKCGCSACHEAYCDFLDFVDR